MGASVELAVCREAEAPRRRSVSAHAEKICRGSFVSLTGMVLVVCCAVIYSTSPEYVTVMWNNAALEHILHHNSTIVAVRRVKVL